MPLSVEKPGFETSDRSFEEQMKMLEAFFREHYPEEMSKTVPAQEQLEK